MSYKLGDVCRLIKSDIVRHIEHTKERKSFLKMLSVFFLPSLQAIFLYRISHYFDAHKIKFIPRLFYTINLILYSADICSKSEIGAYFYMPHTIGVFIFGKIGERCTFYAQGVVGGGAGEMTRDIGGGPGLPCLGNNVTVGMRSSILGPVQIGNGSIIGAYSLVLDDVPENAVVMGIPGKVKRIKSIDEKKV